MPTLVVVSPAVSVLPPVWGRPLFANLPAMSLYRHLHGAGLSVELRDAFADGGLVESGGGQRAVIGSPRLDFAGSYDAAVVVRTAHHARSGDRELGWLFGRLAVLARQVFVLDVGDEAAALPVPEGTTRLAYDLAELDEALGTRVSSELWPLAGIVVSPSLRNTYARCVAAGLAGDLELDGAAFPMRSSLGHGEEWHAADLSVLTADLERLAELEVPLVAFLDEEVDRDRPRFLALLARLRGLGLRADFLGGFDPSGFDEELVAALDGVVSSVRFDVPPPGAQAEPEPPKGVLVAARLLNRAGLNVRARYTIDRPDETMEETNATLALAGELLESFGWIPTVERDPVTAAAADVSEVAPESPLASADPRRVQAYRNFSFRQNLRDQQKIIINLSYRCNNRCQFCSVDDRDRVDGNLQAQLALLVEAAHEGVRALDLDGGEPLMYPHLFKVLRAAVGHGYTPITITTNGRLLAYEALPEKLSRVPGLALLVSMHSHDPEVHDALTRVAGSHAQTLAGLDNALKHLGRVGVNMTITSRNYQDVPGMVDLLRERGVASFSIQYYTPFGSVDPELAPPADCDEPIREALERAGDMQVNLVNFVYCQAPGLEEYMRGDYFKAARRMMFVSGQVVNLADFLARRRYKDERCAPCEWAGLCGGFWDYE